ncbi:MAG: EscU/YscU/HrcU family type III secretion system export apparatus switch protein [Alphaproteobacteria bacterium]
MSEKPDKDSKTEEATEKKVRDSIERGNVPFSREVSVFVSMGAMFLSGALLFSSSVIRLEHTLLRFIDNSGDWRLENSADAVALLYTVIWAVAPMVLPVVLLLMAAGVGSALLQNPPQLVPERLKPKWSRLSLREGWQRLFSLRGLVEFGKALFKLTAVSIVGFMVLKASQFDVLSAMFMEPVAIPELMRKILLRIIGWIALLTLTMVIAYDRRCAKCNAGDH